ncbi:hypothetical protein Tsubulata_006089 [Turnera subulata]|uniref:Peptidase A1 domain-containing protein n=1 Tax=Turnera subulata TaxID=218843 RepID=A0A9Q0J7M4_9ROSI|nr:hypothetical protein Tsubulata_006089 [Turnera subulata]
MNMVVACMLFVVSSTQPLAWNNSMVYPVKTEKFELFHISQIEHNYNMSLHARFERDEKRIKTLAQVLIGEPNIPLVNITVEQGEMLGTLEHIVRLGVGTPPVYQFLAIDTGKQHSCKDQQCRYNVGYGDGSSSKGVLALENFTLGNAIISNIAFGCGNKNKGHFLNFGGILGLGRGIMIGDMKVPIPDQVFQLSSAGKGGVVIDTGTVISRFPKATYDAFRDTFIAETKHLLREKGIYLLDTCYNLTTVPSTIFPNVLLHFTGGPILTLTPYNILIRVEDGLMVNGMDGVKSVLSRLSPSEAGSGPFGSDGAETGGTAAGAFDSDGAESGGIAGAFGSDGAETGDQKPLFSEIDLA